MFRGKKFDEQLAELNALTMSVTDEVLDGITTAGRYMTDVRLPINTKLLEILLGATFVRSGRKNELVIKYNNPIPSYTQLHQVYNLLVKFINEKENPLIRQFDPIDEPDGNDEDDDMGKPTAKSSKEYNPFDLYRSAIPLVQRINKKDMKSIIGLNGESPQIQLCNQLIQPSDILEIVGMAEELKKKIARNEILIAAGITAVVIAAGVVTWCYFDHKKKKEDAELEAEIDDGPIDVSVTLDEPHVYLDEHSSSLGMSLISHECSSSAAARGMARMRASMGL